MRINLATEAFSLIGPTDFVIGAWNVGYKPGVEPEWQAPLHVHHSDDEAWIVQEGSLGFLVDGEKVEAPAGSLVYVKKGQSHTYWNSAKGTTKYLIFMTANVKALIDAIHSSSDRSPEGLRAVFEQFNSELL